MPRVIVMTRFGRMGRFGNQLFQWAFLRCVGAELHATVHLEHWCGEELFGFRELPYKKPLPEYHEQYIAEPAYSQPIPPERLEDLIGKDFVGYAQFHTSWWHPNRRQWWMRFRPATKYARMLEAPTRRFLDSGATRVGIHIRRGDYGTNIFPLVPIEWYLAWLKAKWSSYEKPALLIISEDRSLIDAFKDYDPITPERLGVNFSTVAYRYNYLKEDLQSNEAHKIDFFPDWYFLTQCHVLVIPDSTFSVSAALASPTVRELWKANLPHRCFVKEEKWSMFPLYRDRVDDYPDIEGIAR